MVVEGKLHDLSGSRPMRIVAGRFRGVALATPKGQDIRPTSDRVRESVFNILGHGAHVKIEGARVLDLFAGTGALGFEAISRGAAFGLFVEESAEARGLIRRNAETLGVMGATRIYRRDATRLGEIGTLAPFGLAFADPPYGRQLGEAALVSAASGGWLLPDAVTVMEESVQAEFTVPEGFALLDQRIYGSTAIYFLRFEASS
jgi:16S rRNA (guanine966-N2)-methyltransferase